MLGMCPTRCPMRPGGRCASWWASRDWTATTAARRWWPGPCGTPAWRSSTPVCTRRPEQIVATALAEDADAIGLSVLSGAHMTLFRKVVDLLAEADASDIVVFGGGIIPEADRALLADIGVVQVFTPGATMADIVTWVRCARRRPGPQLTCRPPAAREH